MTSVTTSADSALPAHPSIENLRNRAKQYHRLILSGDISALDRLKAIKPDHPTDIKLADAQYVLARELGFPSWVKLKSYVVSIQGANATRMRPFHTDIDYFDGRVEGLLSQFASHLPAAAAQIRSSHPLFNTLADTEIFDHEFTVDDARLVTAREHGFETWAKFKAHLRQLADGKAAEPFLLAFQAIEKHDIETLRKLLHTDGSLARAAGTNGNTLLNLAGACRFTAGSSLLISMGADVNRANVRGWTPLHQAGYSNQVDLARILLEAAAKPDGSAHGDGGTPLIAALFWGNRDVADLLASYSLAPLNLRAAAGTGDMKLMRSLFDTDGRLKADAGAHRGFYRPHSGFPVWQPSDNPQEILDEAFVYAAKSRRIEAMEFLLQVGADINGDPYRGTALIWVAAGSGDIDTAGWLLDHGADVNQKATFGGPTHGEGVTALHLAAQNGRLDFIKFLIARGADPNITDDLYGGNGVGHANHWGHTEVAEYLRGL